MSKATQKATRLRESEKLAPRLGLYVYELSYTTLTEQIIFESPNEQAAYPIFDDVPTPFVETVHD